MADEKNPKGGPASATAATAEQTPTARGGGETRRGEAQAEPRQAAEGRRGGGVLPEPDDEGRLPELTGRALDIARNTGLRTGGSTPRAAEEYAALDVNPRLDNRLGRQRPQAQGFAPKPQQFPGPTVGEFAEHEERYGEEYREMFVPANDPRGMHSPGPHGRGDDDEFARRIASNPEG